MADTSPKNTKRRRRLSVNAVDPGEAKEAEAEANNLVHDDSRGVLATDKKSASAALGQIASELGAEEREKERGQRRKEKRESERADRKRKSEASPKGAAAAAIRGRRLSVSGRIAGDSVQQDYEEKNLVVKTSGCIGDLNSDSMKRENVLAKDGIAVSCHKGMKPESPNQDDFFLIRIDDWGLYGIFDGHGPFGHYVSNFVQREFPKTLYSPNLSSFGKDAMAALFHESFLTVQRKCIEYFKTKDARGNCDLSGTTGSVVYHQMDKNRLVTAHVGDSRVVLARNGPKGYKAVDLTRDHKPNEPDEKKRIEASGGQVIRLPGDIPYRVFQAGKLFPGLAMSRALGDVVGHRCGITAEPEVNEFNLTENDEYLILASDGVWEFISSQEAVDIVVSHGRKGIVDAVNQVCKMSWDRWVEEEGNVVDDITMQVICLDYTY